MPTDTRDTVPEVRVLRWDFRVSDTQPWRDATGFSVDLYDIRADRLRAIVAVPKPCPECGGSGLEHYDGPRRDGGHAGICSYVRPDARDCPVCSCSACQGGRYQRCPTCGGSGRDPLDSMAVCDCPDCPGDGIAYEEHAVPVRDAIEAGADAADEYFATRISAAVLRALAGGEDG